MRVVLACTDKNESFSMNVYARNLVDGLEAIQPEWEIIEMRPYPYSSNNKSLIAGLQKYYERLWNYPRNVAHQQADLFHIVDHSYGHLVYWLKKRRAKVLVTCHDLINLLHTENLYRRAKIPFVSMKAWKYSIQGLQKADHIIAVSAYTAMQVMRHLSIPPERITIVPNTVRPVFRPLPDEEVAEFRRSQKVSNDTFCILHVGTVEPRKNIQTILKVVGMLKHQNFPVRLWKVGEDFNSEQRNLIRMYDIEGYIKQFGKTNEANLVQIYNAADVLLYPSLYEGFGIPIIEAMACGTPVITSNTTSMPEVAGDSAILVDPTNCEAIVAAIIKLQKEPNFRSELIQKGYTRVKNFTLEASAEKIASIYEQLVV